MRFFTHFIVLALACAPALAAPQKASKPDFPYKLFNDGTKGTVEGDTIDWDGTYHASAFMSRGGCSTTAKIVNCYTADISADPKKQLETKDHQHPPLIIGGIGSYQRALVFRPPMLFFDHLITHTVRFHISTTLQSIPAGAENAVSFVSLFGSPRDEDKFLRELSIRARTFTGPETKGTFLYVGAVKSDGSEDDASGDSVLPTTYPLAKAVGKTIEVTYTLGLNGTGIDDEAAHVASVTAKFVDTNTQLFNHRIAFTAYPEGIVGYTHYFRFGAERLASKNMGPLKVWFGDYAATGNVILNPDRK